MIISKDINVKIINHNIKHYRKLGYNIKYGDIINIPINYLTKGSHYKIKVKCDKCDKEKNIKYQDYIKITKKNNKYYCQKCVKTEKMINTLLEKYNTDNASKLKEFKDKKEITNLKNWGVKNVFQSEEIKKIIKKTFFKKYNVIHPNKSVIFLNKIKETRIKNGNQIIDEKLNDYQIYKKNVLKETRKYINELHNKWNGYDFYDKSYIKSNSKLESNNINYPTIDHKISIYEGFNKNISFKIIGNIDNLCITKRHINCSKNKKSYYE